MWSQGVWLIEKWMLLEKRVARSQADTEPQHTKAQMNFKGAKTTSKAARPMDEVQAILQDKAK